MMLQWRQIDFTDLVTTLNLSYLKTSIRILQYKNYSAFYLQDKTQVWGAGLIDLAPQLNYCFGEQ